MPIELTRPLVYFDLETTGIDVASDKIVEISALRVEPDGAREQRTRRVNPGRPIPAGATAVHGFHDNPAGADLRRSGDVRLHEAARVAK